MPSIARRDHQAVSNAHRGNGATQAPPLTIYKGQPMNLTEEYLQSVENAAKAYDAEHEPTRRAELGRQFDELTAPLSEGQIKQVVKHLQRA